MCSKNVWRIVIIPAASLVSESNKDKNIKCKPSELPIYAPEPKPKPTVEIETSPGPLENAISAVRKRLTVVLEEVQAYQRVGSDYMEQGRDQAEWIVKYLRQEDNVAPKAGAIAIGGLTGLVLGLRGGTVKRLCFGTTGALVMASVCYPKQATDYSKIAYKEGYRYASIAYNFIYGVKKDDPPIELPNLVPDNVLTVWQAITNPIRNLFSEPEPKEPKKKDDQYESNNHTQEE